MAVVVALGNVVAVDVVEVAVGVVVAAVVDVIATIFFPALKVEAELSKLRALQNVKLINSTVK